MSELGHSGLTYTEWNTHHAAWAIVSSPLVIGFDMTDSSLVDSVWPILSNLELIEVNQAYFGFSGSLFSAANATVNLCGASDAAGTCADAAPAWMALYKPIDAARTAVLVINNTPGALDLAFSFAAVPGLPCGSTCKVRDITAQKDLGSFAGSYSRAAVASHDSVFVMLSA